MGERSTDTTAKAEDFLLYQVAMFGKSLVAGGIAGAVSRTVVSPLERLKIIYQLQLDQPSASDGRRDGRVGEARTGGGVFQSLRHMYRTEGVVGFFKGNGTNIVRIVPYSAVQFATYETSKRFLTGGDVQKEERTTVKLASGATAGICSVVATYPLDLVRTRLSLPGETPRTIALTMRQVVATEGGWRALYKGLVPTVAGIAPYVALNFTVYETSKSWLLQRKRRFAENTSGGGGVVDSSAIELSVPTKLACGGLAGAVAQTCTFPLDVIRRRMQVHRSTVIATGRDNVTAWQMVQRLQSQGGWRAFYRGMWPNLLKVVPAISTSFVVYEASKSFLNRLF